MKILQITPFFSPLAGGSAEAAMQITRALAKRGHQVTVFSSDFSHINSWQWRLNGQAEVVYFPITFSAAKFYITPSMIPALAKRVRDFDIIHMHNYRTFQNMIAHHYCLKYKIPYVLQPHGSLPIEQGRQMLKSLFDLQGLSILRHARQVITLTDREKKQAIKMGAMPKSISPVPNGVDLDDFAHPPPIGSFRKKFNFADDDKIVLFLGRLNWIKGLDLLVEGFARLKDPKAWLLICGPDDGYLRQLRKLRERYDLNGHMILMLPRYGDDKLVLIQDANVIALPSLYETFPMVALEAMACGKPIIVSDQCGIANLISFPKMCGAVIPTSSEAVWMALTSIINHPNWQRELGENGKALVAREFTWDKIAPRLEAVYRSL